MVAVVGADAGIPGLDFSESPSLVFNHKGRRIRFLNFSGEEWHVGRKILASGADMVLDVVDSTNLEHDLVLTSRLIDMDCRRVVVFSNYHRLLATGHSLDFGKFGELIGAGATTFGEYSPESFSRLLSFLADAYENPVTRHVHVPYGQDIDKALEVLSSSISSQMVLPATHHDRYIAVRMLENPGYIRENISDDPALGGIADLALSRTRFLEKSYGQTISELIQEGRRGFIRGALQETLVHGGSDSDHSIIQKIDTVLTSRIWGFPILAAVLFSVFQATFSLGAFPQMWIESGVSALASFLASNLPSGWFSNMLVNGVLLGVGAVVAFLPNIIILFFFLSVLEDSGYLARAAFLMDKVMHKVGLHGKSFIPMLIGFGCNVPAIMAARSIEDRRDRTLTMLMIPFMSCSARLPVYMLLVSAFFAKHKALVMISIYLLGIVLSILFAFLMKRTRFFRKEDEDYVSELPAFRRPTWRSTWGHIWERTSDYLRKISTVILTASVIIWALEYFPADRTGGGAVKEESCLAMIGRAMEPVTSPLGFDWRMNVCLLTGLPAKEAIVSTMGILFHTDDDGSASLAEVLRDGGDISALTALAFMAFVLLYFPCVATVSALKREAGGRWAIFTVVHSLLLAWVVAFIIHNVGLLIL